MTDRANRASRAWPLSFSIALLLVTLGVSIAIAAQRSNGHFAYTLDDAYIHMAMAKNLAQSGDYSINRGEFDPAASSAVWPLLIAGIFGPVGPRKATWRRKIPQRLGLAACGALLVLGSAEIGLQVKAGVADYRAEQRRERTPPQHVACGDCPWIYGLNPDHPNVSAQALRDREFAKPKPAGTLRVLVLGDSVTYGMFVDAEQAFPKRLEERLAGRGRPIEVINAGVSGYTAYNELQYYLNEGRSFEPDIVVIALCLNDVVDPVLHWNALGTLMLDAPAESIPNPVYHRDHIAPILERNRRGPSSLQLVRFFSKRFRDRETLRRFQRDAFEYANGERRPIYLTGEDALSIKVLLDPDSPESRWLRSIYERLKIGVERDGADLVVLVLPLAYQLDPNYPYLPQERMAEYCAAWSIACVDVLSALRRFPQEEVFLLDEAGFNDIWHLTPEGHRVVADALGVHLEKELL